VFFIPPLPPDYVVAYISQASIGAITTLNTSLNQYFTSPNKLFEYINAGLPVVCSDLPVLKGIVEGYDLGSTCNPEDPADIASAINRMLNNKMKYDEMKRNTMKAAKIFNWETEVKKLIYIYEKLK
jgi:glycosyltransferase involved in cell wall biosynthesis